MRGVFKFTTAGRASQNSWHRHRGAVELPQCVLLFLQHRPRGDSPVLAAGIWARRTTAGWLVCALQVHRHIGKFGP